METNNMTISMLDPKPALLVVDLQKGVVGMPTVHPIDAVISNSVALIEAFRARKLPVVLINVDGVPARPRRTIPNAARISRGLDRADS
jgi:nicotinamidase-related amidase